MSIIKRFSIINDNQFKLISFLFLISISSFSQVGIGTTTPDASSVLDVTATDKGLLAPRVSLANITTTMLDGTNTAATGLLIYNTNAAVIGGNGVGYYYFNGTLWEQLSTSSTSNDHDWYEEGTTNSPNDINDDKYTFGNLAIGKNTANYSLDVESSGTDVIATNINHTGSGNNPIALNISDNNNAIGVHTGVNINMSGNHDEEITGTNIVIPNVGVGNVLGEHITLDIDGDGLKTGLRIDLSGNSANAVHGMYTSATGFMTGTGFFYGNRVEANISGSRWVMGTFNNVTGSTSSTKTGTRNWIQGGGNGSHVGTSNSIGNNWGNGTHIGTQNSIQDGSNMPTGDKYGIRNGVYSDFGTIYGTYNQVGQDDGGRLPTKYAGYFQSSGDGLYNIGVYSWAYNGNANFSGYFQGNLAVGTSFPTSGTPDYYIFPTSRGTANQVMQTDGFGNVSWVDPSTVSTDNQNISGSGLSGSNLTISIENGTSETVDLSSLQDGIGTDNQNISGSGLSGSILTIGIENGTSDTVNLSSLRNDAWYEEGTTNAPNSINDDIFTQGNVAIGKNTAAYPLDIEANFNDRAVNITLGGNFNTTIVANNSTINTSGFGWHYGSYSRLSGPGAGEQFGAMHYVSNSGDGRHYGSYNWMVGVGIGNKYGSYNLMPSSAGGTHYGVYSSALKTGSFAGYFLGNVSIGTTTTNNYTFPSSRGTNNQIMQTDGSGQLSWINDTPVRNASNGVSIVANDVVLGGTLTQATTITHGTNNLAFNLNSTGDFLVQDNGTNHFEVRNTGITYFGDDTYWNDGSTTGTTIARLYDSGNDGVFEIYKDALVQHQFHSAGNSVINELGQDFDFRIESDDETNMFNVDAGNNRIGIMDATPSFDVHLKQSSITEGGAGGIGLESSSSTNNWKVYHSGANISFAENGVRRAFITAGTGVYVPTSDRRLKKSITEVETVLDKVNDLKTYRYLYKDQEDSSKKTIGFMAQDVQPLFPELVEKAEDGYFGLNYSGFGVIAVKAIQEQQDIIETQQKTIQELQDSQDETNALLSELLKRIESLESKN